ncbi:RAxF-45 family protein [Amphibacillus jilinensis]
MFSRTIILHENWIKYLLFMAKFADKVINRISLSFFNNFITILR